MKKSEDGRSMVEILGVLAIIGVLSVAGIYGYTVAMRKYRINEISQTAALLVINAQSADSGHGSCMTLSSAHLPTTVAGIAIDMKADPEINGDIPAVEIYIQDEKHRNSLCRAIRNEDYSSIGFQITSCGNIAVSCSED